MTLDPKVNPVAGVLASLVPATAGPDSAPDVLTRLVAEAERAGASDIHIQMRGAAAEVILRLDGVMTPAATLPAGLAERICGRVKFLARLKTYQESLPQDGRIDKAELRTAADVRVATYPTVTGEKIVLRLFQGEQERQVSGLGLPEAAELEVEQFLKSNFGLLLLTGPAGSGKTTTIYACLRQLVAQQGRHIITVEDPVEQVLPGIMQTEVNEARGLDFACAARHLLRQDPQVMVIGEIRDEATAQIALRAALTGHLIISTLHAGSCRGVFERLASFCPDLSAIASATSLVLNQRLVRRVCAACSGKGCFSCLQTGFQGRLPLAEFLPVNDTVRDLVLNRNFRGIQAAPTLAECGGERVAAGLTTLSEVLRVS
jgi:type II secretory ATPase GspE/PulE/Tfp pilus assembly ATPase PilB-like protein